MTISFRCPWCNALCAFGDRHIGRRAKCVTCQERFIIPDQSDIKPKKVIEKIKVIEKPKKGFYKAVFKNSWDAIFCSESRATLIHLEFVVIIKLIFFCLTSLVLLLMPTPDNVWGFFIFLALLPFLFTFLFFFCCAFGRIIEIYMTFLDETTCDVDQLPPACNDLEMPIWEHMLKPFFVFVLTVFGAFFPLCLGYAMFDFLGFDKKPLFEIYKFGEPTILLQIFWVMGVLSIPSAFIHIAMTSDWTYLFPNRMMKPIFRAFCPYMLVFFMFAGIFYLVYATDLYMEIAQGNIWGIIIKSIIIMAAQVYILWTVRAAGLFYRHYGCYFKI